MSGKKLGDLNGWWALAFKAIIAVVVPLAAAHAAWITNQIYEQESRNSQQDLHILGLREADKRIEALTAPPTWLLERINKIEVQQERVLTKLDQILMQTKEFRQ